MRLYYEDKYVKLFHGDCLADTSWTSADVLVTDPPYGIAYESNHMHTSKVNPERKSIVSDDTAVARDKVIELWGKKPAIVFGSWRIPHPPATRQKLIWYKTKSMPAFRTEPWFSAYEEIYILGSGFTGKPHHNVLMTNEFRGFSHGEVARIGHPTPKPVPLMLHLIDRCPPGTIVDPFAGSGATLVAARHLRRKVIGIEIEQEYCDLIVRRLQKGERDESEAVSAVH